MSSSTEFRKARRGLREIVSATEKAQLGEVLASWGYVRPVAPALA